MNDGSSERRRDDLVFKPIEDYGIVGDLHTVALIATDGSIDFLCFPYFDSPSVFAALLDPERGGFFCIQPTVDDARRKQLYLPDTNVLLTRFLSDHGVAELSDFMPVEETGWAHNLVRRVKTVRGVISYRMVCAPRFDYGRAGHTVTRDGNDVVFASTGADGTALRLRASVPLQVKDGDAVAEFSLGADEHASFLLEAAAEGRDSPATAPDYVSESFKRTVNYWRGWIGRSTYDGRWRDMVDRSALVLKLLTSQEHGSIVAAPTFGLPEQVGGVRNWDYRYTWIRDASFTIYAFIRLGLFDEAARFNHWIEERCRQLGPDGSLQIMYALNGAEVTSEQELDHFAGYRHSRPVRIGNGAAGQLQLDIYGELMDSVYLYDKYGEPIHHDLWTNLTRLVDWLCGHWRQPDEGIWEVRGGRREFLYSRLMCWVCVDRALRLARSRSFPAPVERWRNVRDEIYRDIFDNFWDAERQAFVQFKGSKAVDAATLLMPLVKFMGPTDPRWLSTLRAIENDLLYDSLVYRYTEEAAYDGLTGVEGTFSICSFWYTECLSRSGDLDKARFYFEKMLGYANHVGLYAEELGRRGEHLGNYPQAFTHLSLISAAFDLDRRLSKAGWNG